MCFQREGGLRLCAYIPWILPKSCVLSGLLTFSPSPVPSFYDTITRFFFLKRIESCHFPEEQVVASLSSGKQLNFLAWHEKSCLAWYQISFSRQLQWHLMHTGAQWQSLLFFRSVEHAFHSCLLLQHPVTRLTFFAFFLYWIVFFLFVCFSFFNIEFKCLCGTFLPTVLWLSWSIFPLHSPAFIVSVSLKVLHLYICLAAWG